MVHFVGAGPGAPDLLTVRAARLLAEADVVVYAGSLVNPQLLDLCRAGCEAHDSSGMTLDEIVDVLARADRAGKRAVRLHTGDPSLYGAVREQMDALHERGIAYDMCPGVSAFSAVAASLGAEYTLPGVSQALVVTRAAGRTAVPAGQELAALASHGASLAIYLSAGLADQVQAGLLEGGVPPGTPAAVVYRASWPDERVLRCTAGTLAATCANAGICKTALIVVGDFLGPAPERSKLYDPAFSHAFREAR